MRAQEADSAYRQGYANGQRARRLADALGTKTWPVYVQSDAWAEPVQKPSLPMTSSIVLKAVTNPP